MHAQSHEVQARFYNPSSRDTLWVYWVNEGTKKKGERYVVQSVLKPGGSVNINTWTGHKFIWQARRPASCALRWSLTPCAPRVASEERPENVEPEDEQHLTISTRDNYHLKLRARSEL
jgi:hypothetical protein